MTTWHEILICVGCFAFGSLIAVIAYLLGHDAALNQAEQRNCWCGEDHSETPFNPEGNK